MGDTRVAWFEMTSVTSTADRLTIEGVADLHIKMRMV